MADVRVVTTTDGTHLRVTGDVPVQLGHTPSRLEASIVWVHLTDEQRVELAEELLGADTTVENKGFS